MTRYLISVGDGAMTFPDEDLPDVAEAAHGVGSRRRRTPACGSSAADWRAGGRASWPPTGRSPNARTRRPRRSSAAPSSTCPHANRRWGAVEIAVACRCAHEVRELLPDPTVWSTHARGVRSDGVGRIGRRARAPVTASCSTKDTRLPTGTRGCGVAARARRGRARRGFRGGAGASRAGPGSPTRRGRPSPLSPQRRSRRSSRPGRAARTSAARPGPASAPGRGRCHRPR